MKLVHSCISLMHVVSKKIQFYLIRSELFEMLTPQNFKNMFHILLIYVLLQIKHKYFKELCILFIVRSLLFL